MAISPPGRRATFAESLRARPDVDLVELLTRRPDLALPSPSTVLSLAARASSRASLEHALTAVSTLHLNILEAVLALDDCGLQRRDVAAALGLVDAESAAVAAAIDDLLAAALLWESANLGGPAADAAPHLRTAPGLAEILGPFPAGLGPPTPPTVRRGAGAPPDPLGGVTPLELVRGAEPGDLAPGAPPGARRILDALTWGTPVGIAPRSDATARHATGWLVTHGLLMRSDDRHVVVPREVGLALRAGRTHRDVQTTGPRPAGGRPRPELVDAEAGRAGLESVRLIARLVRLWTQAPPSVLRSGGLSARDLRRLASELGLTEAMAAVVAELAGGAGLIVNDGEDPPTFRPTRVADLWMEGEIGARWLASARAWLGSRRTPWLVGSRDERGTLRGAFDPELTRPWVPRLRAAVLDVLAEHGTALDADAVLEVLHWRRPRAVPPAQAVAGLLAEAEFLGVTGAGVLSRPGTALLAGADADAGAVLAASLPAEVDELVLQGDLTGIVPGRPSRTLENLLETAADVESRGAATTVRFGAESIARALDHGLTAEQILAELATHSRTPIPQPLDYLIRDQARRHGRLRVGAAASYLRTDDPAAIAGLTRSPSLQRLGLIQPAPTVLIAQVPAAELQAALREAGLAAIVEAPDGGLVVAAKAPSPMRPGRAGRADLDGENEPAEASVEVESGAERRARLTALVARLRSAEPAAGKNPVGHPTGNDPTGDRPTGANGTDANGTDANGTDARAVAATPAVVAAILGSDDPAAALGLLREAIADSAMVWVELVGPDGAPIRRRVRPLTLDAGRLRALDPARDAELTVAVHRIASVTRDH